MSPRYEGKPTAARRYDDKARRLIDEILLLQSRLSQRDVSVLVGLSHQRVYQLRARQRELGLGQGD